MKNKILKAIMDFTHKKNKNHNKKAKSGVIILDTMSQPRPQSEIVIKIQVKDPRQSTDGLGGILGQILSGQKVEGGETEEGLEKLLQGGGYNPENGSEEQTNQNNGDSEDITKDDTAEVIIEKLSKYDEEILMNIYEALKALIENNSGD